MSISGPLETPVQRVIDAMARTVDALNDWQRAATAPVESAPNTASPAPAPRRWWLNSYGVGGSTAHATRESADERRAPDCRECVEVVEAAALADLRAKLAAAERQNVILRTNLVETETRYVTARDTADLWRRNAQMYKDTAAEVMSERDAARAQLATVEDSHTDARNIACKALGISGDDPRYTVEIIAALADRLATARTVTREQVEAAAAGMASVAGFLWADNNLMIDTKQIRRLAAAALRAAGLEVEG